MKKKKVVFKRGVDKIYFPCFLHLIGEYSFKHEAERQIKSVQDKFEFRKNVRFDYQANYLSDIANVIVYKN